ncbi:MAG TPA: MOSC domain-containing protein [Deltaproteobacteria bacterium]|nr:MOSC domain-containing protein [Deltaproteobacteria bacterium]
MTPTPKTSTAASARLLAVSCGMPREIRWRGQTLRSGIFKRPVEGRVEVHPRGLEGDGQADLTVHGGIDKAVYAYDDSAAEAWRRELGRPELGPGAFGENLTLTGCPESRIHVGDVLRIGSATFEVSQPRQPCAKLGMRFDDPGFPKRFLASRRVGFYLRVLEAGSVGAGDRITTLREDPMRLSILELVGLWLDRGRAPIGELERALSVEALAEAWREPLRESLATARHRTSPTS